MKRISLNYRRILAYLFDILLIQLVASYIIASPANIQYEGYKKYYDQYNELTTKYNLDKNNNIKTCEQLEKAIDDKKIIDQDIIDDYEKLKENDNCESLIKKYNDSKISSSEYKKSSMHLIYKMHRYMVFEYFLMIVFTLLYFVLFQGFTNGRTLGKKIMNVKVVSKNNKDITYKRLFVRSLFLGNIIYYILCLIILLLNESIFIQASNIVYYINRLYEAVMVIFIFFSKDSVGIHDIVAGTRIIDDPFKLSKNKKGN